MSAANLFNGCGLEWGARTGGPDLELNWQGLRTILTAARTVTAELLRFATVKKGLGGLPHRSSFRRRTSGLAAGCTEPASNADLRFLTQASTSSIIPDGATRRQVEAPRELTFLFELIDGRIADGHDLA